MKAITVEPKKPETARYEDFPEPDPRDGSILVEAVAVGVCGTDVEIVEGNTAGHPREPHVSCWGMSLWAVSLIRVLAARSRRVTS